MRSFLMCLLILSAGAIPALASEIPASDVNKIVDAIYRVEGGAKAKVPFGILSVPCKDYQDCRRVCYNTVKNNYRRWKKAGRPGDYLEFLSRRYAPANVKNDPKKLNRHWLKNIRRILK